jgi:hypothetical protein
MSTDLGTRWTVLKGDNNSDNIYAAIETTGMNSPLIFVGCDSMLLSHDGGLTWSSLPTPGLRRISSMSWDQRFEALYVGLLGQGVYRWRARPSASSLGATSGKDIICETYPNPTRAQIGFRISGHSSLQPIEIELFDIVGRKVVSIGPISLSESPVHVQWNAWSADSRIVSGIYLYRLVTSQGGTPTGIRGKILVLR